MSERITVTFRDGTKREFFERGRCGGSYTISVKYDNGFVVIKDEWGSTTAFPAELVSSVDTKERNY